MDILWNVRRTFLFEYHKSISIQIFKYSNLGSDCLGHTCLLNILALFTTHVFLCCESLRVISTSFRLYYNFDKMMYYSNFSCTTSTVQQEKDYSKKGQNSVFGRKSWQSYNMAARTLGEGLMGEASGSPKDLLYLCRITTGVGGWVK